MPDRLDPVAGTLTAALARGVFPGATAEIGSASGVIWNGVFGALTFDDTAAPCEPTTIFDLASLTKPIATTTAALTLAADGRLPLDAQVGRYVPDWRGTDRARVTMAHLLEHTSGLSARLPGAPPPDAREFEHDICALPLEYEPGTRALYSDLGFILLGWCIARAGDEPLRARCARLLSEVLEHHAAGAHEARLLVDVPPALRPFTAPTEPLPEDLRRGRRLTGDVHDNYAAALGGFAGHAGLFGTAAGVGVFARALLRALRGVGSRPMLPRALATRAIARGTVPGSSRALGWDTMLPTSSCGARMSPTAFGHVGFTGTSLWIDPSRDRYYVLLTNRVCGGGTSEQMQEVRRAFHEAAADV